ncbi:MAG: glycosyltransferase [bacterium]|nr:glycosyltransferase [bacterium]
MLWISWERHRRTRQLAQVLGAILVEHTSESPQLLRYLVLSWRTWRSVATVRPRILIVQNPSMFLTLLASLLKPLYGYSLVVDRHTNFMINKQDSPLKRVFVAVSNFTIRRSDLTIVTNRPLAELVSGVGGRPFVLPDRIPDWRHDTMFREHADGLHCVCFVCTYASDEPYDVVFAAAVGLPPNIRLYVTGRPPKGGLPYALRQLLESTPQIVITGYLSDEQYEGLINCSEVVMDLTTMDHCLVCGAYEAIAAGKPLILSDKQANRALFGDCAIYVENNDAGSIRAGILAGLANTESHAHNVRAFRDSYTIYWESQLAALKSVLTPDKTAHLSPRATE